MRRVFWHEPSFWSAEELREAFIVRRFELERLVEDVAENRGVANQHVLVVGEPGMGKTALVRRLVDEVARREGLAGRWIPVLVDGASPMGSAGEFWLTVIEALGRGEDGRGEDGRRWEAVVERLGEERDAARLRERALGQLVGFAEERGARLLVVVEGLDGLLGEQLSDDEAWTLRHTLLNEPRIMVVGTATSQTDAVAEVERPMFELFRLHGLQPLTGGECKVLFERVGGRGLDERQARLVQILSAGNPRDVVIMAEAAYRSGAGPLEAMELVQRLVDAHSPRLTALLGVLPVVERRVYLALGACWGAATSREVARRARMEVNKVSAYLARLERRGVVRSEAVDGGTKRYEVTDQRFELLRLLRVGGAGARRLERAVAFMGRYYGFEGPVGQERSGEGDAGEFGRRLEAGDVEGAVAVAAQMVRAGQGERCGEVIEALGRGEEVEVLRMALARRRGEEVAGPAVVREVVEDVAEALG